MARDTHRWVWKAIQSGEVTILERLHHKLEGFDFNTSSDEYGTVFLCFLDSVFSSRGAFSDDDSECREQAARLCKYLRSHGAEPTTQAPEECDESFTLSWTTDERDSDEEDEDKDRDADQGDSAWEISLPFAGRSALDLLIDARFQMQDKLEKEKRWSESIKWASFLLDRMSDGTNVIPKVQIPVSTIDLWSDVLNDVEGSDVRLLCKRTGEAVASHSALLRSASPVLKAMLESPLKEGVQRTIEVEESEEVVRAFLRLACTGCADEGDLEASVLLKVLDLAHRWQALQLLPQLCHRLTVTLQNTTSHLPALCEAAFLLDIAPLRRACLAALRREDEKSQNTLIAGLSPRVQRELNLALDRGSGESKRRRVLRPS